MKTDWRGDHFSISCELAVKFYSVFQQNVRGHDDDEMKMSAAEIIPDEKLKTIRVSLRSLQRHYHLASTSLLSSFQFYLFNFIQIIFPFHYQLCQFLCERIQTFQAQRRRRKFLSLSLSKFELIVLSFSSSKLSTVVLAKRKLESCSSLSLTHSLTLPQWNLSCASALECPMPSNNVQMLHGTMKMFQRI